jgi:hypothetical protein
LELGPWAAGGARSGHSQESAQVDLYDHLLQVCLLLLLEERPAACPELREGLRPLGFEQMTEVLERALGVLAAAGLVRPSRERCADDRAGLTYVLTVDGGNWLRHATTDLRRTELVLGGFLARCGERFVAQT